MYPTALVWFLSSRSLLFQCVTKLLVLDKVSAPIEHERENKTNAMVGEDEQMVIYEHFGLSVMTTEIVLPLIIETKSFYK